MMGEFIYLIAYLLIESMNQILIYVLFFGARLTKSKTQLILSTVALLVLHTSILVGVDVRASSAMSIFTMLMIPLLFFDVFKISNLCIYPFVTLSISIIGISISYILALILDLSISEITQGSWYTVLCQSVPLMVLIGLYIGTKANARMPFRINVGVKQYLVFYVVAISVFLMMAPMQSIANGDLYEQNIKAIGVATSLGCIALVFVTIWQGIAVKKEIEFREKSIRFEAHLGIQREYYEKLLQQEEKMRRFRHDMNAHMIALQAYAENEEIENIKKYLNTMISESAIYNVRKYTGNKIVDALLTQLKEDAERKDILIEVEGYLLEVSAEKSYDLCIILSNLLKNAIEACEKVEDSTQRHISLNVNVFYKKIYINVKNRTREMVKLRGKYPESTKDTSRYHGLGYGNLEYTVNKYQGMIECYTSEEAFEVEIIL